MARTRSTASVPTVPPRHRPGSDSLQGTRVSQRQRQQTQARTQAAALVQQRQQALQAAATQQAVANLLAQQTANAAVAANPQQQPVAAANAAVAANQQQPAGLGGLPPPLVLPNPRKADLKILFVSFGMNADTADEIQKQMFETTDDFILFQYKNFYGFWKAMEKSLAVYANRQIWANPREREQIISLHAWVKNHVMLGISQQSIQRKQLKKSRES